MKKRIAIPAKWKNGSPVSWTRIYLDGTGSINSFPSSDETGDPARIELLGYFTLTFEDEPDVEDE